ncbi:MAG: DNA-binding domain-containing protein [Planctomycetota bacterium]
MRRKCGAELEGKGLAWQAPPPGGGNPRWWIDRRWDERLRQAPVGEKLPAAFQQYSAKQQRDAHLKRLCIDALDAARRHRDGNQKDWINALCGELAAEHSIRVSPRSLLRWEKQKKTAGLTALVDTRGGDNRSGGDPACWDYFKQLYLDQNKRKLATCWRITRDYAREEDLQWPSEAVVRRRLYNHVDRETALKHRDPAKWRKTMAPYIEQDPERFAANECWVSDHSQLDFWCWFGDRLVRPWVTTWQDWRTRKIMGHAVSVLPDSSTILAALRRAILDNQDVGLPRSAWIDNGRDYDAWIFHGQTKQQRLKKKAIPKGYVDEGGFRGIYALLGIEVHFSLPYNPNGKPRQESFYRPMHESYCKGWASYTGNAPENRPERLTKILKTPGMVPDFAEVVETLDQHLAGFNRRDEHTIDDLIDTDRRRLSPDAAMARWCETHRALVDPSVLDLLMQRWHRPVTVGRNGVSIRIRGMAIRYGATDAKLRKFKAGGEKVLVTYDPTDVRSVRVFTQQMRLVGTVLSNRLGGLPGPVHEDQVKELMREKREYAKAMETVNKQGPARRVASPEQNLALRAYEKPKPRPTLLQPIQTPLDPPSRDPYRPDFKQAAGGEHDPPSGGDDGVVGKLQQARRLKPARGAASSSAPRRVAMPRLPRPKRGAEG